MSTAATTAIPSGGTITYGGTLSITAPAAGHVLINGSVSVQNVGCTASCNWWSNIRHIQSGALSTPIVEEIFDSFSATGASFVFPVAAGVNTFDIRLSRSGGGNGTVNGWFAEMNGLYSPFGAGGTGPSGPQGNAVAKLPGGNN